MATVIVNGYAVQDGGYRHLQAQQGIDQAFLTLNFPDALGDLGTLTWNIGTFQNRYGTMGKYDGGMYETYIFGRTHITRRDADREPDQPRQRRQLAADAGARGRRQIRHHPVHQQPDLPDLHQRPAGHSTTSQPYLADMNADYLPYAGSVPQGSTFVHHAHAIAKYQKTWTFGAHYLYTWTPDDNWHPINSRLPNVSNVVPRAPRPDPGQHRGRRRRGAVRRRRVRRRLPRAIRTSTRATSTRSRIRWRSSTRGAATTSSRTSSAGPTTPTRACTRGPQNETGTVDNIAFQYSFSFGALARYPEPWWGDGPDLVLTAFGLLSIVDSKAPPIAGIDAGRGPGQQPGT